MNILGEVDLILQKQNSVNPETRKKLPRIFFFLAAILIIVKVTRDNNKPLVSGQVAGLTMGTIPYIVKYRATEEFDFQYPIDSTLKVFNQSLSTYIPDSEISRFNRGDTLVFENKHFYQVLRSSRSVHEATGGAFDPTVGPLVNAWGFGPKDRVENLKHESVDSLLAFVGFDKISFDRDYAVKPNGTYLDFSAIAKGYAIDLLAEFLESKAITNYMVEIGGEVRTRGLNEKGNVWAIGIEDPLVEADQQRISTIVLLEDRAVATSGNYRNYYEKDGVLYAHIIDPRTGYTAQRKILSASVFAPECMLADAYATGFMVLGVEESMRIVNEDNAVDAILIYQEDGEIKTTISDGIASQVSTP